MENGGERLIPRAGGENPVGHEAQGPGLAGHEFGGGAPEARAFGGSAQQAQQDGMQIRFVPGLRPGVGGCRG